MRQRALPGLPATVVKPEIIRNMKTVIQTPDLKATRKLKDFVHENVAKIGALSDRILEAHVYLKKEKSSTDKNKVCEIKLVIPGNDIFASRYSEAFEEAVTEAVEAVRHQVIRWKESLSPRQQRAHVPQVSAEEDSG